MIKETWEWDIPTLTILQNTVRNFWKAAGDEDLTLLQGFMKGTVHSVGMLRPIRPAFDEMIENN